VQEVAYRFIPCDEEGRPRENSQLTIVTVQDLGVGSTIDQEMLGYSSWEVLELLPEARPLLGAGDGLGSDIPLAGTLVCRGIGIA
jgi:hypothetical protein